MSNGSSKSEQTPAGGRYPRRRDMQEVARRPRGHSHETDAKTPYLDVLRIIALFLSLYGYFGGRESGTLVSAVCSVGPMLYLMVSGAALLQGEESLRELWLGRIVPVFLADATLTILYYVCELRMGMAQLDLTTFLADFYGGDRIAAFWYVSTYLGFLIGLPLLRRLARSMKEADYAYLLAVVLVVYTFLPLLDDVYFLRRYMLNTNLRLSWMFNYAVFFPLMGYCLHHVVHTERIKKLLPMLWGFTLLWLGIVLWRTGHYMTYVQPGGMYHDYERQCYAPLALSIYGSIRLICGGAATGHPRASGAKADRAARHAVLGELAACGYGAYLMQGFFYEHVGWIEALRLGLYGEAEGRALLLPVLVWTVLATVVLLLISWAMRQIPFVRKFFNFV